MYISGDTQVTLQLLPTHPSRMGGCAANLPVADDSLPASTEQGTKGQERGGRTRGCPWEQEG